MIMPICSLSRYVKVSLLFAAIALFSMQIIAGQRITTATQNEDHHVAVEAWRAARHQGLSKVDGWLTLIGLEWLKEGKNRVGSAADNDIRLTGGPVNWGSVFLENDQLHFVRADNGIRINGKTLDKTRLVPDTEGEPTVVASDTLSFHVIHRGSFGLRIKDSQAKALQDFQGVLNYPVDTSWRIDGRFIRAAEGTSVEIVNVLGQVSESEVYGTMEFEMDGKTHSLLGLTTAGAENLWFIFADRTNGRGTYGAGRYLYSDSMPANGRLMLDFNKAYNPPCAFNDYSTCPVPPQRNRLDLKITAGEKDYHPEAVIKQVIPLG